MARNVVVEISQLLRKESAGVGRKRLTSELGRLREIHEVILARTDAGTWPHVRLLDDAQLARAADIADGLHAAAPGLVVVGQPGAVAAIRAIVDALGESEPRWVTSPDERLLAALDSPDHAWLILEGPAWVDRVAEWAVGQGRSVVVAGPGEHEPPPRGWWVSDPVAGDGRFGPFGLAAAVCAAWSGVDITGFVAGAREMGEACARPALFENPAYTLALSLIYIERDLALSVPVHLVAYGRMESFARWLVRMWGAVASDAVTAAGVVRHFGSAGVPGVVGDEELMQVLLRGPRDKMAVLWDATEAGTDALTLEGVAQARALIDLLERENIPYLRVRLPGLDARTLGAATFLAAHAAVVGALFLDLDPLRLDAVNAWYAALERARADVDVGPPIA